MEIELVMVSNLVFVSSSTLVAADCNVWNAHLRVMIVMPEIRKRDAMLSLNKPFNKNNCEHMATYANENNIFITYTHIYIYIFNIYYKNETKWYEHVQL